MDNAREAGLRGPVRPGVCHGVDGTAVGMVDLDVEHDRQRISIRALNSPLERVPEHGPACRVGAADDHGQRDPKITRDVCRDDEVLRRPNGGPHLPVEDQRLLPDEATSTPLPIPVLCATSIVGRAVLPGHAQLATLTTDSATAHEAAIPR